MNKYIKIGFVYYIRANDYLGNKYDLYVIPIKKEGDGFTLVRTDRDSYWNISWISYDGHEESWFDKKLKISDIGEHYRRIISHIL